MTAKKIVSTAAIFLMSITIVMAQKTELKLGETLKPGEPVFSKNGKWVLIMENSVPSGRYGQFATFATSNFSLARDKGIMSNEPKYTLGKTNSKPQKMKLVVEDGHTFLSIMEVPSDKLLNHFVMGSKEIVILRVEDDGNFGFYNSKGERITLFYKNPK